ncbi:hypothetical protein LGZ99_15250 [Photorhabdus temperata]|uniref:Uncharacterized protein n=1 Tax=Photorhabdus temperata subsp. temperata Meg1 TaxID=1393735 RepID=A0A081RVQ1_PHOTE|nr:hypothetical protein [Photorhabdus temperata]KER02754.1 hypothetical protein MEG1DRAFT_02616 [Photorhabdus temperata subsp. temperata Meg1]MCT8348519.1 hypothetical protein [Photorhabdus temperata]
MSDIILEKSKVVSVEFDDEKSPRVIASVLTGDVNKKYGIHWEDNSDDKATAHSLVVYGILLAAMSNDKFRISGTLVDPKYGSTVSGLSGLIKTLKIE